MTGFIHQFHLDLAERAILRVVGGMIRNCVLVPDSLADVAENFAQLAIENRLIPLSARHLGKRFHLVIGLKERHVAAEFGDGTQVPHQAMALSIIQQGFAGAHGIDGNIF